MAYRIAPFPYHPSGFLFMSWHAVFDASGHFGTMKIIGRKHSSNKETHDLGDALELRTFGGLFDLGEQCSCHGGLAC